MTGLTSLWLPILVSSIFVFIASSLIHMVLPWHKSDYPKLANEDKVMDALRPLNLAPGDYMVPRPASSADMKSAEFQEKLQKGPRVIMTVMPGGPMSMGQNLIQWFLFCVVVSVFAAYVTGRALAPHASYLDVFRFAGTITFIGHSLGLWPMSIWYRRSWMTTLKSTFDGLIYSCIAAGTFGWLWPR